MKDDPLGRAWVELAQENPIFAASLRKALIAFHGTDANVNLGTAGTGFIVAYTDEWLFFVSAKHVISEGILKIQKPYTRYDGGPFDTSNEFNNVELSGRLQISVLSDDAAFLAKVVHLSINAVTDIVVGMAEIPQEYRVNRIWCNIPLAVALPSVGDCIHVCSLINKIPVEIEGIQEQRAFRIERGVTLRKGEVTGVYPQGFNQYKWPCFTTSIPAGPGMSGGFAYSPLDGQTIAACGIVCAETSEADGINFFQEGRSVIASSWLALANTVPSKMPRVNNSDDLTLYEMVKTGQFPQPIGDFHRIEFRKNSLDDMYIGFK